MSTKCGGRSLRTRRSTRRSPCCRRAARLGSHVLSASGMSRDCDSPWPTVCSELLSSTCQIAHLAARQEGSARHLPCGMINGMRVPAAHFLISSLSGAAGRQAPAAGHRRGRQPEGDQQHAAPASGEHGAALLRHPDGEGRHRLQCARRARFAVVWWSGTQTAGWQWLML